MVVTIWVTRHGLRANQDPPPSGIDGDVPLSADGVGQTHELAAHLSQVTPRIERIYSSPFYRCLQTATPSAEALKLPIYVEAGIGEHYAVSRPTHPVPPTAETSKGTFPAIETSYESKVSVSPLGETFESVNERVQRALDAIIADAEANGVETILLTTHAAVKIVIGECLAGVSVRAGTCSVDRYDRSPESDKGWKCIVDGDTSFLKGGEQMHWSFDMAYEAGSVADEVSRRETQKVLIPLEFPPNTTPDKIAGTLQFSDLDKDQPFVRVSDQVFEGRWTDIVGTEVYATPQGEVIGVGKQRVVLQPVQTEPQSTRKLVDKIRDIDLARQEEKNVNN